MMVWQLQCHCHIHLQLKTVLLISIKLLEISQVKLNICKMHTCTQLHLNAVKEILIRHLYSYAFPLASIVFQIIAMCNLLDVKSLRSYYHRHFLSQFPIYNLLMEKTFLQSTQGNAVTTITYLSLSKRRSRCATEVLGGSWADTAIW